MNSPRPTIQPTQTSPYTPAKPRLTVPVHALPCQSTPAKPCKTAPDSANHCQACHTSHRLSKTRPDPYHLSCLALHIIEPTCLACQDLPNRAVHSPACHALHRIAIPSLSSQRLPCQSIPILTLPSPEEHCLPLVALHPRPNIQVRSMKCSAGRGESDHRLSSQASSIASHTFDNLFRWKCLALTAFSSFRASSTATFIRSTSFATSSAIR